jgi:hypothetical protein
MYSSRAFSTGSSRSTIALISEKIALVAPMPSASERMATIEKTGPRTSRRAPKRRSFRKSSSGRSVRISRQASFT